MSDLNVEEASAMVASLLADRAAGATLCPSEVARVWAVENRGEDWRAAMPVVHAAVDGMVRCGAVQLSWKGELLEARSGPYRIGVQGKR